jgi:uncharacterized DUF497 family protein
MYDVHTMRGCRAHSIQRRTLRTYASTVCRSEGDGVLNDPLALTVEDRASEGEQRFVSVGTNAFGQLRVVVYTYRGEGVRIISVRKPQPKEVRAYEEGI